jgi:catechol 2,3-dioxygenase-like lactoylglutathione lyase family enzyme
MRRFLPFAILVALFASSTTCAPPKRPQIFGIAAVQIFVTDLPATREFYSVLLNRDLECHWCETESPTCPVCGLPGLPVPLGRLDGKAPRLDISINPLQEVALIQASPPLPIDLVDKIVFATDDLPALRRFLVFHKIEVNKANKPKDDYLTAVDPEGHRIAFLQWPANLAKVASKYSAPIGLIHAGFVVHDRAATDHFYKDILGFRPYWHGGMKDDKDDWVAMQVPGTDWLEYMLNISPNADHHTLGVMNHIALGVSDIHATEKQLITNGWKPTDEPKLGRDGKWQLNLYDPDDTRIEFMEFKPKEAPCCSAFTGPHPGPK